MSGMIVFVVMSLEFGQGREKVELGSSRVESGSCLSKWASQNVDSPVFQQTGVKLRFWTPRTASPEGCAW